MIDVSSLHKRYGSGEAAIAALDGIDVRVERGEIAAVIGASGAGKSTLARCLNALERPTSGSVRVAGRDLAAVRRGELQVARRAIGTIFQTHSLLSRRTVLRNVTLPLEFAGVPRAEREGRAVRLLERVGLGHRRDAYPSQLSGGQRQRVGIARALALEPQVLLSDEATSGLDPDTTRSILELLQGLREDLGLTILLITHEMEVVREIADRVALLRDGKVVEAGAVGSLVADPASALGRGLLPDRPRLDPEPGQEVWELTYAAPDIPTDWVDRLNAELRGPVALLGAHVETIHGRAAGRLVIGVARDGAAIDAIVAPWGLDARRLPGGAGAPVQPPSRVSA